MSDALALSGGSVLFINGNLGRGGGEEVCRQIAEQLRADGVPVDIVNLGPDRDAWTSFEQLGCRVDQIDLWRDLDAATSLRRLVRLIRERDPVIVHTIGNLANLYGSIAGRLAGTRAIVASEHNTLESWTTRGRAMLAGTLASSYIAVSTACAESLSHSAHVPRRKIRLIQNGIDLPRLIEIDRLPRGGLREELGIPVSAPIVGTVGSLKPQKNYPRWLRVAAMVAAAVPSAHFVVIGGGPLERALQAEAASSGLHGRLHFMGARSDGPQLLREFDLFLLTSDREGFGLALCEAQLFGVPVVATDTGGVREVVRDGVTGRLFDPSDEGALAAACAEILLQPAVASSMAAEGRVWIRSSFDGARMANEVRAEYSAALSAKGSR